MNNLGHTVRDDDGKSKSILILVLFFIIILVIIITPTGASRCCRLSAMNQLPGVYNII